MWKDFFVDSSNTFTGLVLEDGSKVGLQFFIKDATVWNAQKSGKDKCAYVLVVLPFPAGKQT